LAIMRGLTSGARAMATLVRPAPTSSRICTSRSASSASLAELAVPRRWRADWRPRARSMAASSGSRTDIEQVAVSLAEIDAGAVDGDADDLLVRTRQADGHLVLDG
jgi:hypothetical protein